MQKNICLKSTLRQPVRTLAMTLICAVVSAAFLSQVLQYAVLDKAVGEIGGYYRSVGQLSWIEGEETQPSNDITPYVEVFSKSPLVSLIDQQRMSSYTLENGWTPALAGGPVQNANIALLYVVGTCGWTQIDEGPYPGILNSMVWADMNATSLRETKYQYRLTGYLTDCQLLCGLPDRITEKNVSFLYFSDSREELESIAAQMEEKERVMVRLTDVQNPYSGADHFYLTSMDPILMRTYEDAAPEGPFLYFYDLPREGDVDVSSLPQKIREDMALLEVNCRSGRLVTTKDMTGIPYFSDDYVLTEGRLLNRADDLKQAPVCVVRQEMMIANGLEVGDALTMDLWKLKDPFAWIRPDLEGIPLDRLEKTTETFTIVGVLACRDEGMNAMEEFRTTVYIPHSLLPEGYSPLDSWYSNVYTSIHLRSAAGEKAFQAEFGPMLAEEGWRVDFIPTGWQNFKDTAEPLRQSARTGALLFGGLAGLTLTLLGVLYTLFRRKELALQLALGVRRRRVAARAVTPMVLLGFLGIGGGAVGAYFHGMEKARTALLALAVEEVLYDPLHLALWAMGLLVFLTAVTLLLVRKTAGRPILEQLQGGGK